MVKKVIKFFLIFVFVICIMTGCTSAQKQPFRLHIIANGNSLEDQEVKLKIRDEILKLTADDLKLVKNKKQAEEYILKNIEIIENEARKTLKKNDFEYSAKAYVGKFEFPEKTYGNVTYKQGEYDALRVVLGEGAGENWWCVMFPPLCVLEIVDDPVSYVEDIEGELDVEYVSFFSELFANMFN